MYTLVNNPPTTTIYCCERGGIHLVIQNINIGMYPSEFCDLNRKVQQALNRVEEGTWPCPFVSLSYYTTVVCLSLDDLPPLAKAMQEAVEFIEEIYESGEASPQTESMCQPSKPHIGGLPEPNAQADSTNTDHLHLN